MTSTATEHGFTTETPAVTPATATTPATDPVVFREKPGKKCKPTAKKVKVRPVNGGDFVFASRLFGHFSLARVLASREGGVDLIWWGTKDAGKTFLTFQATREPSSFVPNKHINAIRPEFIPTSGKNDVNSVTLSKSSTRTYKNLNN